MQRIKNNIRFKSLQTRHQIGSGINLNHLETFTL
jgi:hypothetical protein